MNLDQRLIAAARAAGFGLLFAILCGLGAGVLAVLQAGRLSEIVTGVFLGGKDLSGVWGAMQILLVVILLRAGLSFLSDWLAAGLASRVKVSLRDRLYQRLLELGPARVTRSAAGELVATALQDVDSLEAYFCQYLPQVGLAGLIPLAVLLFVFPLDPISGVILVLTGPLIPFFMFLIGANAEKLTSRQLAALGKMSAYLLDTLQGLKTLKALGRSRSQAGRIEAVSERYRAVTMEVLRITFLSALALELLGTLSTAVIAVQIGLRLLYGGIAFEQAFFILVIAPDFYQPLRNLGLRFHASRNGVAAARRIFAVLETPVPELAGFPPEPVPSNWSEIVFEDVGYQYEGREEPALEECNFRLRRGERVALVGESGAGKTTVANLLMRFLEPQSGLIWVDDRPLACFPASAWRRQIAEVSQKPGLFQGSLADNLRIANEKANDEELWQALELAHLADWVRGLPSGLSTEVGEQGARLSGGQAQRLALARAFLRDSPLLILDEPTAHLDPQEEALLADTTGRLCQNRTVLVIAHRLATIYRADRICVMTAGRVSETGSHAELLALGGRYARMIAAYGGGR